MRRRRHRTRRFKVLLDRSAVRLFTRSFNQLPAHEAWNATAVGKLKHKKNVKGVIECRPVVVQMYRQTYQSTRSWQEAGCEATSPPAQASRGAESADTHETFETLSDLHILRHENVPRPNIRSRTFKCRLSLMQSFKYSTSLYNAPQRQLRVKVARFQHLSADVQSRLTSQKGQTQQQVGL